MTSPRLFVVGDIGGPRDYHLGDEGMLEANLHMLRQLAPGIEFTVPSRDPSWTRDRYGVDSLPAHREPALPPLTAEAVRKSDGLVVSGGGNMSSTWPEKIIERVALIEEARNAGRPVVVVGQTLGPALTEDQRRLLAGALPYVSWMGVREESSEALALQLGVPPDRVHRHLDDAFFLEPQAVDDERVDVLGTAEKPWILVTIDASYAAPQQAKALRVIASQLDALAESLKGTLLFVPHVGGANVPAGHIDLTVGWALRGLLRSPLVVLDLWQPREARWLADQAAMVVSTRYHPLVFAAAAGVPALGVYSDRYTRTKLRGALAWAGLENWCLSATDATRGMLLPLAMELWHQRDAVAERLARLRAEAWPVELRRWEAICGALGLPRTAEPARPRVGERVQVVEREKPPAPVRLSEQQWWQYEQDGFLRLGRVLDDKQLEALRQRMDDIMLGKVRYPTLQTQLDTGGAYEDLPDAVEGAPEVTLAYRKVQGLEADPLVLDLLRKDLFREICARHYGNHASISIFRAMMMNKPAGQGTYLPWHQDGGDVWKLDRDPLVTLWIALDPATVANGCLQVIPGSHRLGLLSKYGSTIGQENVEKHCPDEAIAHLTLEAGEGLLLHNWLIHRSDVNHTNIPRRAVTFCYMDGRTLNVLTGKRFPVIFGELEEPEASIPYLRALAAENLSLRETADTSERYAKSLVQENEHRERMRADTERYAHSLETEKEELRQRLEHAGSRIEELDLKRADTERYARSLEAERENLHQRLDRAASRIDELDGLFSAILMSRSWRIGHAITAAVRRLLGRRQISAAERRDRLMAEVHEE